MGVRIPPPRPLKHQTKMITAQEAREITKTSNSNLDKKIKEFVDKELEEACNYIRGSARNGKNSLSYYFLIEAVLPADLVVEEIKSHLEKSGFEVTRYPVPRSSTNGDFHDVSARIDISWK